MKTRRAAVRLAVVFWAVCIVAVPVGWHLWRQSHTSSPFTLRKLNDSLYHLNDWRLPYPVFRFEIGDVDGDGEADALVGVVKATRYYKEKGRRLFVFKQVNGKARPLWLGSKLAGRLQDFRYMEGGTVRSLETWPDGGYSVAEWRWKDFGFSFERFLTHHTDSMNAIKHFER